MTSSKDHERKLIEKLLAGDRKTLDTLYHSFYPALRDFVYVRINDKHVAEELAQDIFLQFLDSARDFRFESSIKTFLYTIARNKVIDYIRKKKVKKVFFSHIPSFIVEGLATVVMDDELERKDLQQKLEQAFAALPHDYQLVLRLKYIDDKPVGEIAQALSRTFKSTESLLFRARQAFIAVYNDLA